MADPLEGKTAEIPGSQSVSTKRQRIADLAQQAPSMSFTSLHHHIDMTWMREAYRQTRKSGAAGVDGQSAGEFAEQLEENLQRLLEQLRSGQYRAPPVRRHFIPKAGKSNGLRPIGIPTFADKVLQRAVSMVLESIYEQDFLDCSYGFRTGRSAHHALQSLWDGVMPMGGAYVVELDIRQFFDNLQFGHLRDFLRQRVRDGVLLRAVGKWLNAGVMEEGQLHRPKAGSPQGGVISPILANLYLHHVLDLWFEHEVRPRMRGKAFMVRYADDALLVFRREDDARRVLRALPKRFARYGLELHPEKTKLVRFKPVGGESFEFLGFTHVWSRSRRGRYYVKRRTARSRLARGVQSLSMWCRRNRHRPVREQHAQLVLKLRGHYAYYGITGNMEGLKRFYVAGKRVWRKWLDRRNRERRMDWETFTRLLARYPLPKPRVVHSVYATT